MSNNTSPHDVTRCQRTAHTWIKVPIVDNKSGRHLFHDHITECSGVYRHNFTAATLGRDRLTNDAT